MDHTKEAMHLFLILTITLVTASFSLGGAAYLYLRYRTRVLRLVLLFLSSLLLIAAGFWITRLPEIAFQTAETGFETAARLFQLAGGGLNIAVLPYFVSALVSIPLDRPVKALLWGWNGLFIFSGFTMFLFPRVSITPAALSLQQAFTILGTLVFLTAGLRRVKNIHWKGALTGFLVVSGVFLILLVLDILITLLPIRPLNRLDNLSLPVYLAALTLGTFFFAGRFLSRDAMVKAGELTDECREFYNLTARETEIIGHLLEGASNKEIGDRLFISPKTVENHLYNIYQKMDVGSRTQLIGTLRSWERED